MVDRLPPASTSPAKKVIERNIEPDRKLAKRWEKLGWDQSFLQTHPDFCKFLFDSRLAYTIRGYQNSPPTERLKEGIHRNEEGEPCLLQEGRWVPWKVLKESLYYDSQQGEVLSRDQQEWSYFYNPETQQEGLIPETRYNKVRPIYQLTQEERTALHLPKKGYALQIFTSANGTIERISHVGVRLIHANGWVYSPAFETPSWEPKFRDQAIAGVYDASIASLDYDEFGRFKHRRVTTVEITEDQFERALKRVTDYSTKSLRFNRIHQNCATYAIDIMKSIGIHAPDICCPLRALVWDFVKEINFFGPILDRIVSLIQTIFSELAALPIIGLPFRGINALAGRIATFFANLVIYAFGASKASIPTCEENDLNNEPGKEKGLTYFHRLIGKWSDIFDLRIDQIYSPVRLVNWQLVEMHKETVIYPYAGPRFYIAPTTEPSAAPSA